MGGTPSGHHQNSLATQKQKCARFNRRLRGRRVVTIREIGCCGAYCKTCIIWQTTRYPRERACAGCKLGYGQGGRDLSKAKCRIKVCCFRDRGLETCADCAEYPCAVLREFWGKNGTKYKQYMRQIEFIRENGYDAFLRRADRGKGPRGSLNAGK